MPERAPAPLLVKLGGSLLGSPLLSSWLEAVVRTAPRARLLVPGGGPFADAVRRAQHSFGFSDLAAHRMAILAMQQTGLLLLDREPRLDAVEDVAEIEALSGLRRAGVWLPWRLCGGAPDLPASWQVTSDSIALWFARRLGARAVVIVKRGSPPRDPATAAALGVVDEAFPHFLEGLGCPVHILGEEESSALSAILGGGEG